MKDIRFLGLEGDYLLLEDSDSQKYRLLLDEPTRRAIRGETARKLDDPTITPREIQEEIRVGRTIEDIIRSSGASEEYVRKFAQPVLDELDHAVRNALMVRLEIAGDRFSEPTAREFGEIIKSRLAASGAGIERWSAMKAPDHGFIIYCEFELGGETKKASWSYDPRRLALSPENDVALTLSSQDKIGSAPIPKLRPISSPPTNITANLADTVDLVASMPPAEMERDKTQENLSETADLLDALRRKRLERESFEELPSHPDTATLRIVEFEIEQELDPIPDDESDYETNEPEQLKPNPEATPPKKGRASIPSWDEIVFGTKTED